MEYHGYIYRPPLEVETFLLPVTEGCSHNKCKFCNMFAGVHFRPCQEDDVEEVMREGARQYHALGRKIKRVYLAGADPFVLSIEKLERIVAIVHKYVPEIETITMNASIRNIIRKSDEELVHLKSLGINDLYVGVESGLTDALTYLNKGNTAEDVHEQLLRLNQAGYRYMMMFMLGSAGKGRGEESAKANAALINELKPAIAAFTTMSAFEGTQLTADIAAGVFTPAKEKEILSEEKLLLELLDVPNTYLMANHILDSVPLSGNLGENKEKMLAAINYALEHIDEDAFEKNFRREHI